MANKERVQLLVDALRSGKYKQGHAQLRTESNGFCCLGVACDVYRKTTKQGRWFHDKDGMWAFRPRELEYENGVLPQTVSEWFGFDGAPSSPVLDVMHGSTAITLNDTLEWDFNQIADAFERTYIKESEDAKQP